MSDRLQKLFARRAAMIVFERHKQLEGVLLECIKRGPGFAVVAPNMGTDLQPSRPGQPELQPGTDAFDAFDWEAPYITTEKLARKAVFAEVYTQPKMTSHQRLALIAKAEAAANGRVWGDD